MNSGIHFEVSYEYDFTKESASKIGENLWVKNQWPLVYFLRSEHKKIAYIGESTNAFYRFKNHLANPAKDIFNKVRIIGCDRFNKSAALDIESRLIQYISSEGTYQLQNGNHGLINHRYYQQDIYRILFREIWQDLIQKKIVTRSIAEIENSEIFKYSPYKALSEDQYKSVLEILEALSKRDNKRIFVSGSAGTGKTVVAVYLMKLLHTDVTVDKFQDYNDDELREIYLLREFRVKYPNPQIGLVIAMTSLRDTLKKVFRNTPGLSASMVISPSDTFKRKYDLLIVDEAHRLRQYRNHGFMGVFRKNNKKVGLGDEGTELDWITHNSRNQLFFYDAGQTVKPSDVDERKFHKLLSESKTLKLELKSQMRLQPDGNNYIQFVQRLFSENAAHHQEINLQYDILLFESLKDLHSQLKEKEDAFGLCRMVAGYSWPWISKQDKDVADIKIEGLEFKWNQTDRDWINSPTAFEEVGCIHTTQGYDLNYTGVIFGREIDYNHKTGKFTIAPKQYYDIYGKKGIKDEEVLKKYIINIYSTLMYRGIKGTYVYAYNEGLREYFKRFLPLSGARTLRFIKPQDAIEGVNAIRFINIAVAAGSFSEPHKPEDEQWVEIPQGVPARKGFFICRVTGESMNKKIPNGSYCLFREDPEGTRKGKIVLVQSSDIHDSDFGEGYTVKEYDSTKNYDGEEWSHQRIILKPQSHDPGYQDIVLTEDSDMKFKVLGIFEKVLEERAVTSQYKTC